MKSEIKHIILLTIILVLIISLAFSLEVSDLNKITDIRIEGNKYLSNDHYLNYAQLTEKEKFAELSISLIRDRIEKHPYIENTDVILEERGIVKIEIFEKKMDAVLLNNSENYLITDKAELIPLIPSTSNIDLPVIVNNNNKRDVKLFDSAAEDPNLFCALKIISTAELYDFNLYKNISEINLTGKDGVSIILTNFSAPVFFGKGQEIEKTVFLSKIFKQLRGNNISEYVNYVDLRYNELVYLGFDEKIISQKEQI